DVMGAYHGLVWHNQRFYYNPVTSKLEPVGYDGFPIINKYQSSFIGNGALNKNFRNGTALYQQLFYQEDFYVKYINYLQEFTSRAYIMAFLDEIRPELEKRLNLLKVEFPHYKFAESDLIKRTQRINLQLLPLPDASLHAFRQSRQETKGLLKISNLHGLPMELIGTGRKRSKMDYELAERIVLPGYQNRYLNDKYTDFELPVAANYLFYKTLGLDSVFSAAIIDWPVEQGPTGGQELFANANLQSNAIYTVTDSLIYFKAGEHSTNRNIIIPAGMKVQFAPGTTLDLYEGASFISRSPVEMVGEPELPIVVKSRDGTAGGFSILQAGGRSLLRNVKVENFNTLNYKDWTLTGAVTFYESDVDIYNSVFTGNNCEDGLNIVRSAFLLDGIIVSHTFSDGLDVDFGEGRILRSNFIETGNDGLDLSGSKITIVDCLMENCGDKGISVGEETTATIESAVVNNALIGVASKDLSRLTIQNIDLKNCQLGFTAYQKKPEFGGSRIEVQNYTAEGLKYLYKMPPGSTLFMKGERKR
ncbi:MAG: right-handed parallel beta-helix repeat-containing protein, partial [Bacteroidota bacterium]